MLRYETSIKIFEIPEKLLFTMVASFIVINFLKSDATRLVASHSFSYEDLMGQPFLCRNCFMLFVDDFVKLSICTCFKKIVNCSVAEPEPLEPSL